jgi:hypothetical protein
LQLTLNAKAARKIGFPLSNELVQRELIIAQGTITEHKIIRYKSVI